MTTGSGFDGWDVRESGPVDAAHSVLLLPGGLCTTAFYEDLMSQPKLVRAPVRLVAATLPGFGNTPYPRDLSMENYARLAGRLAADTGCDVVVGHSLGANVAIEMVAAGDFSGPVVLLSPTFSRADEARELAFVNRVDPVPVIGSLIWTVMLKLVPYAARKSLPEARRETLTAELRKNNPAFCRRIVRNYFAYLDRHGSLVPRLCRSGSPAWVVRGDRDEVGFSAEERRDVEACPGVTLVEVPDATHMVMTDQPGRVAEIILEVIAANPGQ